MTALTTVCAFTNNLSGLERMKTTFASKPDLVKSVTALQLGVALALVEFLKDKNTDGLTEDEKNKLRTGDKISPIKSVRTRLNMGLVEAKSFVENEGCKLGYMDNFGIFYPEFTRPPHMGGGTR